MSWHGDTGEPNVGKTSEERQPATTFQKIVGTNQESREDFATIVRCETVEGFNSLEEPRLKQSRSLGGPSSHRRREYKTSRIIKKQLWPTAMAATKTTTRILSTEEATSPKEKTVWHKMQCYQPKSKNKRHSYSRVDSQMEQSDETKANGSDTSSTRFDCHPAPSTDFAGYGGSLLSLEEDLPFSVNSILDDLDDYYFFHHYNNEREPLIHRQDDSSICSLSFFRKERKRFNLKR